MLAAAAAIVVAIGGAGVFGPLGSVISGSGRRSATEGPAASGAASSPIVAAPARQIVAGVGPRIPGSRPGAPGSGPGGGLAPGSPRPSTGRPSPTSPSGGAPAAPGPQPPSRPPGGGGGGAVQTVGETLKQLGHQAPAPAHPVTDQVDRVVDALTGTCRRLPACP